MADPLDLDAMLSILVTRGGTALSQREREALVAEVRHLREAVNALQAMARDCAETRDRLIAQSHAARRLLARAIPHIDPNDSDAAYQLLRECEEATHG